jgi:phage terminase large subunit-like protein
MMRALTFFSALRLPESGEPFVLLPWQVFVIGSWAGWLKQTAAGWIRRIRTIYCEAGKGSGKSPLAGGFGLYGLVEDGEPGAQVLLGATKREQAGIVFDDARKMVEASPMLSRIVQQSVTTLSVAKTGSVLRAVSSEARTLDGWRGHFIVVDELHEHPSDLVLVKLSASTKGRLQPCILTITDAGVERTSACWQQHQYALQVLEGTIEDDTLFAYVAQLDACADCLADGHVAPVDGCTQCDNWKNEALWPKTNPSLPITPTVEYLRAQVREAVGMPAREALVRRLNFCEWLEAHSRWLDMDAWHGCTGDVTAADLLGRPCYAGLDLGQSDDFSAFVQLWVLEDGRVVVRARFWLPESALRAYPTRPYDVWRRAGHLTVTEGSTTDTIGSRPKLSSSPANRVCLRLATTSDSRNRWPSISRAPSSRSSIRHRVSNSTKRCGECMTS